MTYKQALANAVSLSRGKNCIYHVYRTGNRFEVIASSSEGRAKLDIVVGVFDGIVLAERRIF